jgi:hypothetical protein
VGAEISHLIVDSLIKLAEQRRGAIVVFPGKEPISAGKSQALNVITTPIYLESIYNDTNIYCKIIAPPAAQPADKRWPDVEVVIQVGY